MRIRNSSLQKRGESHADSTVKVLNTDAQETNVQMQTENKAQNTQNTEVSGVESTGESAGTKKKTTVSTGQTGVTDAESARWVAGLQ